MSNPTDYREAVAAEVRAAMGRRRITQAALASAVGMSRVSLSERLAAKRPFDLDQLLGIATALGMDIESLLAPASPEVAAS